MLVYRKEIFAWQKENEMLMFVFDSNFNYDFVYNPKKVETDIISEIEKYPKLQPQDTENEIVHKQKQQLETIERFIQEKPKIIPKNEINFQKQQDISIESVSEKNEFLTETLANIYINQKLFDKAKKIYSKLSLKYPEKSIYFAAQIEKVNQLIKTQ